MILADFAPVVPYALAAATGAVVTLFVAWPIAYHSGAILGEWRARRDRPFNPTWTEAPAAPVAAQEAQHRAEEAA